jgi:predicted TIM-barrel fold metal-dependent hydrolase
MSDERLWPIYAVCQELGVSIIGHSGARQGRCRFRRAAGLRAADRRDLSQRLLRLLRNRRVKQLAQLIKDIGPQRVMMGSDYPWYDLDHTVDGVMELPILSAEEKAGILGSNALNILKL